MGAVHAYAATCPKGVEGLLADELAALGADRVRESRAAVTFAGPLPVGYRACLWSRLASRILLILAEFPAATADQLYAGAADLPWEDHLSPDGTLAVDAVGATAGVVHSGFAALRVKDAVVDRLRRRSGRRPSVDTTRPDLRVNLRLHRDRATVALDLSGEPLHRRGYRAPREQTAAPLKENLAAAILLRAGWPAVARAGGTLLDPLCGSGTLLIEGALMAIDQAPGLLRRTWGFSRWSGHDPALWNDLVAEAAERTAVARATLPYVAGWDADAGAVHLARANIHRAGLAHDVIVETARLATFAPPPEAAPGLVVTNPPHGIRLGRPGPPRGPSDRHGAVEDRDGLEGVYRLLGNRLLEGFVGWDAAVFTPDPDLARATGLRARRLYTLFSGGIEAKLYVFSVGPENVLHRRSDRASTADPGDRPTSPERLSRGGRVAAPVGPATAPVGPATAPAGPVATPAGPVAAPHDRPESQAPVGAAPGASAASNPGVPADMFANRLRKNLRHLGKWARREGVTCYRVYDADLPEYAVAVDLYAGAGPDEGRRFAHVQEYAAPPTVDPARAEERLAAALAALPEVLEIDAADVSVKVRRRQRGSAQYERAGIDGRFVEVGEGGLRFLINLTDYLDTGLFLDHRLTRARLRDLADGRRFLNLFAYTGTASVYASKGGARSLTTVDLSATYLDWARRNLELNGIGDGPQNRLVRADVLYWLGEEQRRVAHGQTRPYDLIFLDPPTFSNSARMGERTFAVERDHVQLIRETAALLSKDGVLVFSTNHRKFRLDAGALADLDVTDITRETIPPDFARNPRIHSCFVIRPAGAARFARAPRPPARAHEQTRGRTP